MGKTYGTPTKLCIPGVKLNQHLSLVALSSALAKPQGTFIGTVPKSEAFIALVVSPDKKVMAYVCDGRQVVQWFKGQVRANNLELKPVRDKTYGSPPASMRAAWWAA